MAIDTLTKHNPAVHFQTVDSLTVNTAGDLVGYIVPLEADAPLNIVYTSGSTGKPKGLVHVHSYIGGLSWTFEECFGVTTKYVDTIYVVSDPGWITGQSYMITGPLVTGVTTVLAAGSPTSPKTDRFLQIIASYGVCIFKAGSTFLKSLLDNPEIFSLHDLSSLRVATFCAEPVNEHVHKFASRHITKNYINSYWATEHGGIVWSIPFTGNEPLPDTKNAPLGMIEGDVLNLESMRYCATGELGDVVIKRPYPYLARTIWGDDKAFCEKYFVQKEGMWLFLQGDLAVRHADGKFTFHGRSDDVINVSGNRISTEEIEGIILRHDNVSKVAVVGIEDDITGNVPVAFIVGNLDSTNIKQLRDAIFEVKGSNAIPAAFVQVSIIPETRSGKYLRRVLKCSYNGKPTGDLSSLKDPDSISVIQKEIDNHFRMLRNAGHNLTSNTERIIVEAFVKLTGSSIERDHGFASAGLTSAKLPLFIQELEHNEVKIRPTDIFDYPSPKTLAKELERRSVHTDSSKQISVDSDMHIELVPKSDGFQILQLVRSGEITKALNLIEGSTLSKGECYTLLLELVGKGDATLCSTLANKGHVRISLTEVNFKVYHSACAQLGECLHAERVIDKVFALMEQLSLSSEVWLRYCTSLVDIRQHIRNQFKFVVEDLRKRNANTTKTKNDDTLLTIFDLPTNTKTSSNHLE
eukprot:CAMPEP_0183789346 /NCGR_PEP_ID=MMETSP0803_2-20130417/362_1 /TAXON_ID=195967 /ORGANISM="Crustomastix stigmata, Strain CCMP3273" /LENGTH=692 /DNA_ID=CAMNT_0026033511 /DNA_START=761 /DNA_END=2839 /DNA_ORIENTATION=+